MQQEQKNNEWSFVGEEIVGKGIMDSGLCRSSRSLPGRGKGSQAEVPTRKRAQRCEDSWRIQEILGHRVGGVRGDGGEWGGGGGLTCICTQGGSQV